jgi:mono/diheme cytochrome c family protein
MYHDISTYSASLRQMTRFTTVTGARSLGRRLAMTPKPRGQTMAGHFWKYSLLTVLVAFALGWAMFASRDATGGPLRAWCGRCSHAAVHESPARECDMCNGVAGTWYWLRSPDEEKRAVIGLYNRYCIRCHGVDGRGVWDIPDVPNFTDPRWQTSRSDNQLARIIVEGRGAVMPPFRGTLSLEEACAMGRYLRIFVPGTETSRPAADKVEKPAAPLPPEPKPSSGDPNTKTPQVRNPRTGNP